MKKYIRREGRDKLTPDIVLACRQAIRSGESTLIALATRYNISPTAMGWAVRGSTWRNVPGAFTDTPRRLARRANLLKEGYEHEPAGRLARRRELSLRLDRAVQRGMDHEAGSAAGVPGQLPSDLPSE